jgi:hypothetical protein
LKRRVNFDFDMIQNRWDGFRRNWRWRSSRNRGRSWSAPVQNKASAFVDAARNHRSR